MRYLSISKPLKLKGRSGYKIIITEGPIIIKIIDNFFREIVKFSEIKIVFNISALNESFNSKPNTKKIKQYRNIYLFKLYPGAIVCIEDCDISCDKNSSTNKLICFQVNSKLSEEKEEKKENIIMPKNNNHNNIPSIKTNNLFISPEKNYKEKNNEINILPKNVSCDREGNPIQNSQNNNKNIISEPEKETNSKNKNIIYNINLISTKKIFSSENNLNFNNSPILNQKNYHKISILNIISSKISKFYQTIRAGENSITNIEKSFINNNVGKSIVFLNPLMVKISECVFENNYDNAIHIKFKKDENFVTDPRKLIFEKNEISYNHSSGIYIDGIDNFAIDLDLYILGNIIKKNKVDGIFIYNLLLNSMIISDNKILGNKANGINLYKVNQKFNFSGINPILNQVVGIEGNNNFSSSIFSENLNFVIIKNNEFTDNEGLGIFFNDSRAILHKNSFHSNKASGMIMCNINFFDIYNKNSTNLNKINLNNNNSNNNLINLPNNQSSNTHNPNNSSTKANTIGNNSFSTNNSGITIISECTFNNNCGSGLKIYNYNNLTYISNCKFHENTEYGLHIENDNVKLNNSEQNLKEGGNKNQILI